MDALRVLVTHEPRAYRQTMAAALRCLRPDVDVIEDDATMLPSRLEGWRPHLVIGSSPDLAEVACRSSWVLLYPRGSNEVVISVGAQRQTPPKFTLDALLDVVDRTERLARADGA